ncbi:MAG: hypothetical protein QNJ81_14455 [Acidimicrobiia bacterium]|nr:hypothetical protein [Acidimicrobiia bacterium]
MQLFELYDNAKPGYQDVGDDSSQLNKYEPRKTRLTLKQINKIRLMNDVRNYERKEKLKAIQDQYGPSAEAEGGGDDLL